MSATEQGLGTWNQSIIQTLSPTIALIVIYCITGVIGNGTVLIIYKTKNLSRKGRFFIPILAFVDLCASVVCSICVLFRLCFNVLFVSDILCKGLFFIPDVYQKKNWYEGSAFVAWLVADNPSIFHSFPC